MVYFYNRFKGYRSSFLPEVFPAKASLTKKTTERFPP